MRETREWSTNKPNYFEIQYSTWNTSCRIQLLEKHTRTHTHTRHISYPSFLPLAHSPTTKRLCVERISSTLLLYSCLPLFVFSFCFVLFCYIFQFYFLQPPPDSFRIINASSFLILKSNENKVCVWGGVEIKRSQGPTIVICNNSLFHLLFPLLFSSLVSL